MKPTLLHKMTAKGAKVTHRRAGLATVQNHLIELLPRKDVIAPLHALVQGPDAASIGHFRVPAERAHSFLVVRATTGEHVQQVADIARRFNATRAQKYGSFLIEELIEVGSGEPQVFESADRGLDSQTRLGVVGDTERVGR